MSTLKESLLETYLREINRVSLLTAKEEKELAYLYQKGDNGARERLITANLRLVVKIAKRYVNCGLPLLDLIEEGNLGLLKAVERFDPSKNCRFSTYATCWIKHTVCRALSDKNQVIRIPLYMKKLVNHCKENIPDLTNRLGRPPTIKEIVQTLNLPVEKRKIVEKALVTSKSLDSMKSLNIINLHKDVIEDPRLVSERLKQSQYVEFDVVEKLLASMDQKKAQIIRMRFGLSDSRPMTLKEVGEKVHLTKERVRQIEKETIKKIRYIIQKNREIALKRRETKFARAV